MKKLLFLLAAVMLVFTNQVKSQSANNIKVDMLGFFRKTTKISWEHFTTPTNSISFSAHLSDNVIWEDAHQKLARVGISSEYRYYLGKKINYSGLYVGMQLRYQYLRYQGNLYVYDPLTYEYGTKPLDQTINTAGYGILFGYQELSSKDKKTAIDMSFGFVWNTGSRAIHETKQKYDGQSYEFTGFVRVFPQANFAWSFGL